MFMVKSGKNLFSQRFQNHENNVNSLGINQTVRYYKIIAHILMEKVNIWMNIFAICTLKYWKTLCMYSHEPSGLSAFKWVTKITVKN